jgi:MFS family permease
VDDCFFLHERGAKIGYYTASLCLAGLAPVPAGYMLDSGTWRLLYYILAGLAGALFVLGFFIVVETRFDRSEPVPLETLEEYAEDHNKLDHRVTHVQSYTVPLRKTYLQQINPWSGSLSSEVLLIFPIRRSPVPRVH